MALPPIVGPLYIVATLAAVLVLLWKKKMGDRVAVAILAASLAVVGFLQWGFLDTTISLYRALFGAASGGIGLQQAAKVVLVLATALIAGRLFCGYACPLGAAQELASRLGNRQARIDAGIAEKVRAIFFFASLVLGVGLAMALSIDPFRLVAPWLGAFGLLALIVVAAAGVFVYRPYCTLVCPFGFLMALASRFSLLKLRINGSCVDCGACTRACPTGQAKKGSSMAECYLCGRCLKACRKDAISYGRAK